MVGKRAMALTRAPWNPAPGHGPAFCAASFGEGGQVTVLAALSEATTEPIRVFAARSCGIFLLAFAAGRSVVA